MNCNCPCENLNFLQYEIFLLVRQLEKMLEKNEENAGVVFRPEKLHTLQI